MNNMKKQMDDYFAGLNLSLIRRQIKNYCRLVLALDEETLTDISLSIAHELNVNYDETRLSVINGFLNDYMNKEIGERTLFHCIIGACDTYNEDLPEYVLKVSHAVLESVYDMGEDENGCDCSTCGNMECPRRGAETVAMYDLGIVMKGILEGKNDIMDGDVKVPMEVVLSTAEFMDSTGLTNDELIWAVNNGVFEGKIVETAVTEEESEGTTAGLDDESLERAIANTEKNHPGVRERMIETSEALKAVGVDMESMVTSLLTKHIKGTGSKLTEADIAKMVKTVLTRSN